MRAKIQRTITATIILSSNVSFQEDGQVVVTENTPLMINGKVSEEKALKLARKEYGLTAQVTTVNTVDDLYEISVEDFLKYATKVVEGSVEETAEEV